MALVAMLYGRSIADSCLTCRGPKRVPGRNDVPISMGMPTTQTSSSAMFSSGVDGSRMNVPDVSAVFPALGIAFPDRGWLNVEENRLARGYKGNTLARLRI